MDEGDCDICGDHRFLCWSPFEFMSSTGADKVTICDDPLTYFNHWLLFETSRAFKSICFAHYGGNNLVFSLLLMF